MRAHYSSESLTVDRLEYLSRVLHVSSNPHLILTDGSSRSGLCYIWFLCFLCKVCSMDKGKLSFQKTLHVLFLNESAENEYIYIIFVGVIIFFSYNQTIVFCIDLDVMKYLGSLACNVSKDNKELIRTCGWEFTCRIVSVWKGRV